MGSVAPTSKVVSWNGKTEDHSVAEEQGFCGNGCAGGGVSQDIWIREKVKCVLESESSRLSKRVRSIALGTLAPTWGHGKTPGRHWRI